MQSWHFARAILHSILVAELVYVCQSLVPLTNTEMYMFKDKSNIFIRWLIA